jgi:hypothetical protein
MRITISSKDNNLYAEIIFGSVGREGDKVKMMVDPQDCY